jgi:hypothetical protein
MMKNVFVVFLFAAALLLAGCAEKNASPDGQVPLGPEAGLPEPPSPPPVPGQVIGGDKDAQGCLVGAGYTWDPVLEKCVRPWLPVVKLERACKEAGLTWVAEYRECAGISQEACEASGGSFNECASACRHDPEAEVCTLQCVLVCDAPPEE